VVLAEDVDVHTIKQHIRAGIELKKDTDNHVDYEYQVILQHLAASKLNPNESVLTVMTDLNERWHFYWFGQKRGRLYKIVVNTRGEAKFLFEHMFDSPNDNDDDSTTVPKKKAKVTPDDSIDSSISLFPSDMNGSNTS
jgi:hypothetical protein